MNVIAAIKKAREIKGNVLSHCSWFYRSEIPGTPNVSVSPGLVNPDYLATLIGYMPDGVLMNEEWEVVPPAAKEETIKITSSAFWNLARKASSARLGEEFKWTYADMQRFAHMLGFEGAVSESTAKTQQPGQCSGRYCLDDGDAPGHARASDLRSSGARDL